MFSGGIKLDVEYTPALLYQVAKMDGAIVLNADASRICWANVQLMPDPTILSMETGTRHRTAERVSKQTEALVISISERRDVVSLYLEGMKYILQDIPTVLSKANQGLATLEKYRARLDQVVGSPHGARVRGRGRALRRALGAPAGRDGDPDGVRGRALHHRARHRGAADRDAARGDRRRRDGRARGARARLRRPGLRREPPTTRSPRSRALSHQDLLDFGRLAELLGFDRKMNTLEYPVTRARLPRARPDPAPAAARRPADHPPLRRARRDPRRKRLRARRHRGRRGGARKGRARGSAQASGGRPRRPVSAELTAASSGRLDMRRRRFPK